MSSCNIPPCTPAHPLAGLPPRVPLNGTIAGTMETSSHGVLEHGGAHGRCAGTPQPSQNVNGDGKNFPPISPQISRKRKATPLESEKTKVVSLRVNTDVPSVPPAEMLGAPRNWKPLRVNTDVPPVPLAETLGAPRNLKPVAPAETLGAPLGDDSDGEEPSLNDIRIAHRMPPLPYDELPSDEQEPLSDDSDDEEPSLNDIRIAHRMPPLPYDELPSDEQEDESESETESYDMESAEDSSARMISVHRRGKGQTVRAPIMPSIEIQIDQVRAQQKADTIRKLMQKVCPTWQSASSHM